MFNGSTTSTLLMIVLFVALGYFMLVRPGRTQAKKQAELMKELAPGARVQTQIGVYGTLVEMGEVQARVEIAPGVVITVDKRLISGITPRSRDEFHTYPEDEDAEGTPEDASAGTPTEAPTAAEQAEDATDTEGTEGSTGTAEEHRAEGDEDRPGPDTRNA